MKQRKKDWVKPMVKSLSVKESTLSGKAPHVGEQQDPAYKKGWQSS